MLAGHLPFALAGGTRTLFDMISVDGTASASISTLVSALAPGRPVADRVTQREALEIPNAKITCRALEGLTSVGVNPITYSLGEVEELARSGVSVLEVAARTERPLSFVYHAIRRAEIETVAHGLWDRQQVRERFAAFNA